MREHMTFIISVIALIIVVAGSVLTKGLLILGIMLFVCCALVLWMIWDVTHPHKLKG